MALPLLGLLAAGLFSSGALTWGADKVKRGRMQRESQSRNQGLLSAQQGYGALPTERERIGPVMPGQQPEMVPDQPGSGFLGTLSASNPMAAQQLNQQVGLLANPVEDVRNAAQSNINSLMTRDYSPGEPDAFTNKLVQMGYKQGTPEYTAAARELAMKPSTQIDMGGGKLVTATDAERIVLPDGTKPAPGTRYEDLPGMNATFITKRTPEQAGKISQMRGAQAQIPLISSFMFKDDGSIDRLNVFNAQMGIPGTEGQTLGTAIEAGVQAITRSETGAAMPDTEVDNARKRFQPKTLDSDLTIRLKWDMYQDFLNGAISLVDSGGVGKSPKFNTDAFDAELAKRIKAADTTDALDTQEGNVVNWEDM